MSKTPGHFYIDLGMRSPSHVTKNINVVEQRAPTDESIRLYSELLGRAFQNVTDYHSLENNLIDFSLHHNLDLYGNSVIVVMKINGRTIEQKIQFGPLCATKEDRIIHLFKEMSAKLSQIMIEEMLENVSKNGKIFNDSM